MQQRLFVFLTTLLINAAVFTSDVMAQRQVLDLKQWQFSRDKAEWKDVNIIEAEVCPDHIHMLVEIPPKMSVSSFMGYLKGKSSTILYEQFSDLKYRYRNREFWCRGYYVDTVGKNKSRIAEYIRNQLKEDQLGEQLTIPEAGEFKKKR